MAIAFTPRAAVAKSVAPKTPAPILYQTFFKSAGPRTYAAQRKQAGNGNHFLVLTEGKRDKATEEVRKTRLYIFSEDFDAFFEMIREIEAQVKQNPVPPDVRRRQTAFWNKQKRASAAPASKPQPAKAPMPIGRAPQPVVNRTAGPRTDYTRSSATKSSNVSRRRMTV